MDAMELRELVERQPIEKMLTEQILLLRIERAERFLEGALESGPVGPLHQGELGIILQGRPIQDLLVGGGTFASLTAQELEGLPDGGRAEPRAEIAATV